MDASNLPRYSLRDELVRVLAIHAERSKRGRLPVLPPRGVLEALNEFGPRLDDRWIRVIEAMLDGLWQDGLIGRIPAPSPYHVSGYCSRRAAERAILLGAPIIVMPLRRRTGRSRGDRPLADSHPDIGTGDAGMSEAWRCQLVDNCDAGEEIADLPPEMLTVAPGQ
jgi:hypothetical protein